MFKKQLVDHPLLHSDSVDYGIVTASFVKGHLEGRAGGSIFQSRKWSR